MADRPGDAMTVVAEGNTSGSPLEHTVYLSGNSMFFDVPTVISVTNYYKMRGKDVDCIPLTYRTWVVSGVPDPTGASYVGTRCGVTPFAEVVIAEAWQV